MTREGGLWHLLDSRRSLRRLSNVESRSARAPAAQVDRDSTGRRRAAPTASSAPASSSASAARARPGRAREADAPGGAARDASEALTASASLTASEMVFAEGDFASPWVGLKAHACVDDCLLQLRVEYYTMLVAGQNLAYTDESDEGVAKAATEERSPATLTKRDAAEIYGKAVFWEGANADTR